MKDKEKDPKLFFSMTTLAYAGIALTYLTTIKLVTKLFTPFNSQSFALNSFSEKDPLGMLAYLSFGTSILASFPLILMSIRTFAIYYANKQGLTALSQIRVVVAILLFFLGSLGIIVKDIGKVAALAGAVFGTSMIYIFPAIMYLSLLLQRLHSLNGKTPDEVPSFLSGNATSLKMKILVNIFLLSLGVGISIIGGLNSLINGFFLSRVLKCSR